MQASQIVGSGSYLPERVVTNEELARTVDTSNEWIVERTGIHTRHRAAPDEATSDLAVAAGRRAIEAAGLKPVDVDAIIVATVTADLTLPSAACLVQAKLGCAGNIAFDIAAGCAGFVYALVVAEQMVRTGACRHVLVIGAEALSRIIDPADRSTCVLFGDGAGAVVIGPATGRGRSTVLSFHLGADGSLADILMVPAGGSARPPSALTLEQGQHFVHMRGREVYKNAIRSIVDSCRRTLADAGFGVDDVTWFIPHQANARIIETVREQLDVPAERIISNLQWTGNTSAASIPIALDQAVRDGRLKREDTLLITAFGAGVTTGTALLRF